MYLRVPQEDEEYEYEEEEEEGEETGEGLLVQLPLEDIARARMGVTESRSHHKKSKKSKKKHHRHVSSVSAPAADDLLRATGLDDISDEEFQESRVHTGRGSGNFSLYDKAPNPGKKFPHAKSEPPSQSLKVEIDLNRLSLGKRTLPGKSLPGKRQSLSSSEQEPAITSSSYHATPSFFKKTPPSYEPLPPSSSSEKKKKKKKKKHRHSQHPEAPPPSAKEAEPMEEGADDQTGSGSPLRLSFDDSFSSSKSFNDISSFTQLAPAPSVPTSSLVPPPVENEPPKYVVPPVDHEPSKYVNHVYVYLKMCVS